MKFFLIMSLITSAVYAQNFTTNSPLNAAIGSASALVYTIFKPRAGEPDSISGICAFEGKFCSGASIDLFLKDRKVYSTTLTSGARFMIPGLKRHEDYDLVLTWPKYNLVEKRVVKMGDYLDINIKAKP